MFKDYFRDAMTETEKGRLHEALKQIRRMEFDTLVVKELMRDELVVGVGIQQELFDHQRHVAAQIQNQALLQTNAYNQAQGKYGNAITGSHISTTIVGSTGVKS